MADKEMNRYVVGVDISTQTVTAMLIGVREAGSGPAGEAIGAQPVELELSGEWTASRPCRSDAERKSPQTWVGLVRECLGELKSRVRETSLAEAVGVSTTFPGLFPILRAGGGEGFAIDPAKVSLYDNTDDAGLCAVGGERLLSAAESDTLNRMWPGSMAVGLVALIRNRGLRIEDTAALVPPNTAFAWALIREAGFDCPPDSLFSDFTQTSISGLYGVPDLRPLPEHVAQMLEACGQVCRHAILDLLPRTGPSWRNVVGPNALPAVRNLLGLPLLNAVSIGAGDSPLGSLALMSGADTVINVRGSSDSPMILVDRPASRSGGRETVLHYPLPAVVSPAEPPWLAVAPMLRSGRVWDWVRGLRFPDAGAEADRELEDLAARALKRRLSAPPGSAQRRPLEFNTALGGERAPDWDPRASGTIRGLLESHDIGDIALAALEGMSGTLSACISQMESRYRVAPARLLLAGGPTRNRLWSWITGVFTGKQTLATTFSDASLMGAALLGYAAAFDGKEPDRAISDRLLAVSRLSSDHPFVRPVPVEPPDAELAALERSYRAEAASRG